MQIRILVHGVSSNIKEAMLRAARLQARQRDPVLPFPWPAGVRGVASRSGSTGSCCRAWNLAACSIASLLFDENPCTRMPSLQSWLPRLMRRQAAVQTGLVIDRLQLVPAPDRLGGHESVPAWRRHIWNDFDTIPDTRTSPWFPQSNDKPPRMQILATVGLPWPASIHLPRKDKRKACYVQNLWMWFSCTNNLSATDCVSVSPYWLTLLMLSAESLVPNIYISVDCICKWFDSK